MVDLDSQEERGLPSHPLESTRAISDHIIAAADFVSQDLESHVRCSFPLEAAP